MVIHRSVVRTLLVAAGLLFTLARGAQPALARSLAFSGTCPPDNYSILGATVHVRGIALGPDNAVWFTSGSGGASNQIGRVAPGGAMTMYALPVNGSPGAIVTGADGALWFAFFDRIGRITVSGTLTYFALPSPDLTLYPADLIVGTDGALWFSAGEQNGLGYGYVMGRITTTGVVSKYLLPELPGGIAAGPPGDGGIWFTYMADAIGRLSGNGTGAITQYPFPPASTGWLGATPRGITLGPDGALWFSNYGSVGRISTSGELSEFAVEPFSDETGERIVAGPDGALWITHHLGQSLGRVTTTGTYTETAVSLAHFVTPGPDGAIWFGGGDLIGRLTTDGSITEFLVPNPRGIATGFDGKIWVAGAGALTASSSCGSLVSTPLDPGSKPVDVTPTRSPAGQNCITFTSSDGSNGGFGRVETICEGIGLRSVQASTVITSYHALPTPGADPRGIARASDGSVWFTEFGANLIGHLTPGDTLTEYPILTPSSGAQDIALGPDGAFWFTEAAANKIGRVSDAGAMSEFALPLANSEPHDITGGPDGALWFTEFAANRIGRITPAGAISQFLIPTADSGPTGITLGPDGALWFTEAKGNKIGRITPAGALTERPLLTANSGPEGITTGPDGNIWFTERLGNKFGQIILPPRPRTYLYLPLVVR
jgi:streptogramin lyase